MTEAIKPTYSHEEFTSRHPEGHGFVSITIGCAVDLPTEEQADELLRWQAAKLREMADAIERATRQPLPRRKLS